MSRPEWTALVRSPSQWLPRVHPVVVERPPCFPVCFDSLSMFFGVYISVCITVSVKARTSMDPGAEELCGEECTSGMNGWMRVAFKSNGTREYPQRS